MQYLYLIKCQQFYKIGIASDVQSRLAQLSTGNPFDLEVLAVYGFDNANTVETAIHQRYAEIRKRGEWYALDDHDISDIGTICQMLGGKKEIANTLPTDCEIEQAEEIQESLPDGAKFDYAAMFADGWHMQVGSDGKGNNNYWCWRKRNSSEKGYIYGGRLSDLPRPVEEMRRMYGGKS